MDFKTIKGRSRKPYSLEEVKSPFFYFDSTQLASSTKKYAQRKFTLNYSVKACIFDGLVTAFDSHVDGFSVSSTQELLNTRKETKKPIHFVSPLIRKQEIDMINKHANSVAFNSLEQLDRLKGLLNPDIMLYLRVNPEISLIEDDRYDPCRKFSKLGIPLEDLKDYLSKSDKLSNFGIHFHNACQEEDAKYLNKNLKKIRNTLGLHFYKIKYINIGGGYLFSKKNFDTIQKLSEEYGKKIIVEPGFDLINSSGYLVSSVVDLFKRHGKDIAVLDTSVNHLPEVFEYQCSPEILEQKGKKKHSYILAGATCLAGDLFGEYKLSNPLKIGDNVIFKNVGAYSVVKLHGFNGIEIPQVLIDKILVEDMTQKLKKQSNSLSYKQADLVF